MEALLEKIAPMSHFPELISLEDFLQDSSDRSY